MIEALMTIALLCQVKPIKLMSAEKVDQYQLTCQQDYIKCLANRVGSRGDTLTSCVLKRIINEKGNK